MVRADALHAYVTHGFEDLPDGTIRLRCRGEAEAAVYDAESVSTWDRLEGVALPVVAAVGGSSDSLGPAALTPRLVDFLPDSRLRTHADLTHFGPFENPSVIAAEAIETLSSLMG
jgi:hypothetical protein